MLDRLLTPILKEFLFFFIYFYQVCISPLFISPCRFTPSCSQYTMDAIWQHGPYVGIYLGVKRILRCQPFSFGGYDPVDRKSNAE